MATDNIHHSRICPSGTLHIFGREIKKWEIDMMLGRIAETVSKYVSLVHILL